MVIEHLTNNQCNYLFIKIVILLSDENNFMSYNVGNVMLGNYEFSIRHKKLRTNTGKFLIPKPIFRKRFSGISYKKIRLMTLTYNLVPCLV